jgi:hypothetical protein
MNEMDEALKKRLDSILSGVKNREGAKNTLALLFPKAERALKSYLSSENANVKANILNRRISQKDFSANYFTLSPATNAWGITQFQNLFKEGPDKLFDELNRRLELAKSEDHSDIRRLFLELLDSLFSSKTLITKEWLDRILVESPAFLRERDRGRPSYIGVENEDRLRWLIVNALTRLSEGDRAELLKDAIAEADDLSVLSDVVRSIAGDLNPEGAKDRNEEAGLGVQTDAVRDILIEKVSHLAKMNDIWRQANPSHLLWFWWGANKTDEVKDFTNRTMDTAEGLRGLLKITVTTVISSAGNYDHVNKSWPKIVDISKLTTHAQRLLIKPGDDDLKQLAVKFLAAVERGRESPF